MKEKVFNSSKMRELRKEKGLSQKQLADLTGLSLSAIQGYEQGRYEPKYESIDRIAFALGVLFTDLINAKDVSVDFTLDQEAEWLRTGGSPQLGSETGRKAAALVTFEALNEAGQRRALDLLEILLKVPEYKKNEN